MCLDDDTFKHFETLIQKIKQNKIKIFNQQEYKDCIPGTCILIYILKTHPCICHWPLHKL